MIKYKVELRDFGWYRTQITCMQACPVHTDSGKYVQLITQGKYKEAYLVARSPNPIASICGRVCAAPCEDACRRGKIDAPVTIRSLKRFVTEKYGSESSNPDTIRYLFEGGAEYGSSRIWNSSSLARGRAKRNKRVAIIGAGAAGLACAHDLSLLGYQVTIFEASQAPGGMARLGIPEYRLPRAIIDNEVSVVQSLGVDIKYNSKINSSFGLKQLRELGYDAIFIATGLQRGRELDIPGRELDGVVHAIDFLLNVNRGYRVNLGSKVVVIGGGAVALDAARTAVRMFYGDQEARTQEAMAEAGILHTAVDVARSAVRAGAEVIVASLESFDEMPAMKTIEGREEIHQAIEEGIRFLPSRGPKRFIGKNGRISKVELLKVSQVFDSEGRFNPLFVDGSQEEFEVDSVILAIGQQSDLSFISSSDGVEITSTGLIRVNPETMETTAPGVFAGGDVAFGPRILIEAAANGKTAAQSIHRYLSSKDDGVWEAPEINLTVSIEVIPKYRYKMPEQYELNDRASPPCEPLYRRTGVSEVELTLSEDEARVQAERCLNCHVYTIYDSEKCVLCGSCVDVCPENCLKIVTLDMVELDEFTQSMIIHEDYGKNTADYSVMVKDDEKCIRCGLCSLVCPTEAFSMERFSFSESIETI